MLRRLNVYHHSDGIRKIVDGADDRERGNLRPSRRANFVGQGLHVRIGGNFGVALGVCRFEDGANELLDLPHLANVTGASVVVLYGQRVQLR
jgi:hypothetical protein